MTERLHALVVVSLTEIYTWKNNLLKNQEQVFAQINIQTLIPDVFLTSKRETQTAD